MARGPKPKKTKQEEAMIRDVAKEILSETQSMSHDELKKRVDEEFLEATEQIDQAVQLFINTANDQYDQWDVKADEEIKYFDATLTYEITGYRPVDETHGLDFDPSWFTEVREVKLRTGRYCSYPFGTKKYADFWNEQFRRCNEGYVTHGYRITGDNYFFLNFYRLKDTNTGMAGMGRQTTFPQFYSKQYEYFHYIDLCRRTKHDVVALKARGVGFSEIAACLGVRLYSTAKGSTVVYAAFTDKYVRDVLDKCWEQLDYLNADTEGGMRHVRQKYNSDTHKRASLLNKAREEFGFMSDISGVTVDKPSKLRGDRVDLLLFEESGSNPNLVTTYIQSTALVEILGNKFGLRIVWGTGGDQGALEGLKKMFFNPEGYSALPYRHNYTQNGDFVTTGFFIPAFTFVAMDGYIDKRGVTNTVKAKEYYNKKNLAIEDPQDQIKDRAEFCFTPEDALALDGDNLFDRVILTSQKALMELHKQGPHLDVGVMEWDLEGNIQKAEAIKGVRFKADPKGHVIILEHPVRTEKNEAVRNMYVAGVDGIDLGKEDTSDQTRNPSNFAVVIMKRASGIEEPKIVAVYKDRPDKLREAHLQTLRLLWYYNCQAVLESTRVSLLNFFREWKLENRFLMRRPTFCQNNGQRPSAQFGAQATEYIIKHQIELIQAFVSDYGHNLWFPEIVNELLDYRYDNKGKFDLVAALGMCMLGDEELMLRGARPRIESDKDTKIQPFGYWRDEKGIKHKGRIPTKPTGPTISWIDDIGINGRTSTPAYRAGVLP